MEKKKWKSCARWSKTDVSTDTHYTKEAADAVCKALRLEGLGGMGEVFPWETWVEEIKD